MAKRINLSILKNYTEPNTSRWNDIRYMLIGIDVLSVDIIPSSAVGSTRFDEEEISSADIIIFEIDNMWHRIKDHSIENAIICLQKIKEKPNLNNIPIVLIYDEDFPDIDLLKSQILNNYNRHSDSLLGADDHEQFADLVGKIIAKVLNKSIDRNFNVPRHRIFLSHSWKDKKFARKLGKELAKSGAIVWIDEAEIKLGDSLIYKISKAIEYVDYFAVLISHNSIDSPWVQKELEIAMTIEFERKETIVLPLILDNCPIPYFLKGKLYADMSTPDKYKNGLSLLKERMSLV